MLHLTLAIVVYLALDFGNPLMPGAVSFDANQSVEATRSGDPARAPQPAGPTALPPGLTLPDRAPRLSAVRPASRFPARPREAPRTEPEPDSPHASDDH